MFGKSLTDITLTDLESLVVNKVPETTRLDYKECLPADDKDGKRDLLQDITALANTVGGYLVYGIREEVVDGKNTGIPEQLVGILGLNENEVGLWIENLVRTCTEPRLVGVQFHTVTLNDSTSILILGVPRSWSAPHAVSIQKHWRFYARNSRGNYQMDVNQLRDAFSLGSGIQDKLISIRDSRIDYLTRKYQTARQEPIPLVAIHVLPFDSLRTDHSLNILSSRNNLEDLELGRGIPVHGSAINFDGLLVKRNEEYLQLFNSGRTEEVVTRINCSREEPAVKAEFLERSCILSLGLRLRLLKRLQLSGPMFICISVLGVKGHRLEAKGHDQLSNSLFDRLLPFPGLDRSDLVISPIFLESLDAIDLDDDTTRFSNVASVLRPALDSLWNGFGVERCLHYDLKEAYKGHMSVSDSYRLDYDLEL